MNGMVPTELEKFRCNYPFFPGWSRCSVLANGILIPLLVTTPGAMDDMRKRSITRGDVDYCSIPMLVSTSLDGAEVVFFPTPSQPFRLSVDYLCAEPLYLHRPEPETWWHRMVERIAAWLGRSLMEGELK